MKNLFVVIIAVLLVGSIQETKAQFSVGAGLGYASDISSLGISANVGYEIDETWAASGSYTHFLEKDYVKWSAIDFNANYNISEIENLGKLYAIGGINITTVKLDFPDVDFDGFSMGGGSVSDSNFGVNIGAGLKVDLSEKMFLAPEITYSISSGSYLRIGAKLMFKI
ncbi:outer membrane beta-barrel protein [Ancylomarina sp. YFZ004]